MSWHLFGAVVTGCGCAANNRGETEGNITTLQKILWKGQVHSTVSSEAIRWAMRYYWQANGYEVNRMWNDDTADHEWQDPAWKGWAKEGGATFIDDDLLGYMVAEGAKVEGEKGTITKRRGVFEVARAVSTTPYAGDISFNAKSGEKGRTSLYGTEMHSTRYQYGFAMTPERLREKSRCLVAIDAVARLGEVAGNHSRFLFDFSPESIVLRLSHDPAPRILYIFEEYDGVVTAPSLINKVEAGDISADELFIGGAIAEDSRVRGLNTACCTRGILEAIETFKNSMREKLELE